MSDQEPVIGEDDVHVMYTEEQDAMWNAAKGIDADTWEDDPFSKNVKENRQLDGLSRGSKRSLTNKINKRMQGDDAGSKAKYREQLTGYDLWDVVPPLYNLEHLALLMEKSTVHHAAVMAKVSSTVSVGFELSESNETLDRLEEASLDDDEETLDFIRRKVTRMVRRYGEWLDDVNEEDTFVEILEKWITDYESMGVGALEIGRKPDGSIGYIGHIPSQTIRPRKDRDGYVQIVDDKVTFFRNFGDQETEDPIGDDPQPNEIIYLKKYSPRTTYYGIPDIIPALTAVAGVEFAKKYNIDYFENKTVPRHLIVVRGARLSASAEQKLINFFNNNLQGKHHRAVYIPMGEHLGKDAEIEFKPVEEKHQDASFEKYIDMGHNEVLMAHRVPKTKVGLSADVNLAVARDADRTFKESVTKPLQKKVQKYVNYILSEVTNIVVFQLKELSLVDEETQSKIDETYLRNGARNVNEVRADRGWKAVDGGDEYVNTVAQPDRLADERSQARNGRRREQEESRSGPDSVNSDQGREPKT